MDLKVAADLLHPQAHVAKAIRPGVGRIPGETAAVVLDGHYQAIVIGDDLQGRSRSVGVPDDVGQGFLGGEK